MPDISQHPWKCAWMTTSLLLQRKPNDSIFKTKPLSKAVQHTAHRRKLFIAMQNSHQAWKTHQISQGNSSFKEKRICGYRYIHIRDHQFDQLSEQVLHTQCTHTSGYRLQARESPPEFPTPEDGKFQHGGISKLQCQ